MLKEWTELVHNLISYIGSVDDHQASSTALLPSKPDSDSSSDDSQDTTTDKDEVSEEDKMESGEKEEGERVEEGGKGEVLEFETSPDVLKVEIEKWRSSLSYAIDSQDTQTTEKVADYCIFAIISMISLTSMAKSN